jgi:hypothetical protein
VLALPHSTGLNPDIEDGCSVSILVDFTIIIHPTLWRYFNSYNHFDEKGQVFYLLTLFIIAWM